MPLRCPVERVGVDLRDDERHVVVHAPGGGVVDDGRAARSTKRCAHAREVEPPAENSATSKPSIVSSASTRTGASAPSIVRPARALATRTARPRSAGNARRRSRRSRSVPTAPVAPTTATRTRGRPRRRTPSRRSAGLSCMRTPRTAARPGWCPSPDSSKAACSARTASGTRSPRTTHEILIGDVEIISMLIPSSPSMEKTLAATPGCVFMPGADDRDLAHLLVGRRCACPARRPAARARVRAVVQVVARHGEGHVRARARRTRARSG